MREVSGRQPSAVSARDARQVMESQPRLWIEAMLDDYDRATMQEAREAILARVGAVLFNTFGVIAIEREPAPLDPPAPSE